MLLLSRKKDQEIMIGNLVRIVVVEVRDGKVRLGIQAPKEVPVHRRELFDKLRKVEAT